MGSFANYWENEILDHLFGKGSYTPPTIYVGISTVDGLFEDGSGFTEPSGNGYGRVATDPADWTVSSGGVISNANDIVFPEASGSWGWIFSAALFDAASGGNLLVSCMPAPPRLVVSGKIYKILAGNLSITLD